MRFGLSILGAASLFVLVACGSEPASPTAPSTPTATPSAPATPATPAATPAPEEPEVSLQFASLPEPFKTTF